MFKIGQEYNRKKEIHEKYGGQRQGGISTPSQAPYIFLFTSDKGEQHGYKDEFRDDGIFYYTGEGQSGDMRMAAGNLAICDHEKNGKTIYLFEYTRKAHVRLIGTTACLGFHEEIRPDGEGNPRRAIVFHLDMDTATDGEETHEQLKSFKGKSLDQLRAAALTGTNDRSPKIREQLARYRSDAIKAYVLARAAGKCEGCGCDAPFVTKSGPYLECHHLHRLSDGGPDHPENVIGLCPNCHRRSHYSVDAMDFNEKLKEIATVMEQKVSNIA